MALPPAAVEHVNARAAGVRSHQAQPSQLHLGHKTSEINAKRRELMRTNWLGLRSIPALRIQPVICMRPAKCRIDAVIAAPCICRVRYRPQV